MKILNVYHELLHNKDRVTVEIDMADREQVSRMFDAFKVQEGKEYDFTIKRHYEKRSRNANSYFHQLIGELAAKLGKTFPATKNMELERYGQRMLNSDGNLVYCLMNADINYEDEEDIHLVPTGHMENHGGVDYEWFYMIRPTHTYNSREFAILLDGVIQDAKDVGIETMTPNELARLKGLEREDERIYIGEPVDT